MTQVIVPNVSDDLVEQVAGIIKRAREVYENHEGDGAWIAMERAYFDLIRAKLAAAEADKIGLLIKFAAECHRAKWQFDLSEDFQPSKASARALITKAFEELHRIGDLMLKEKDAIRSLDHDGGGL